VSDELEPEEEGIFFTQFLRPDGRRADIHIVRPPEILAVARKLETAGVQFEAEVLRDDVTVSFTASLPNPESEVLYLATELVPNGPKVLEAVDKLVMRAFARYNEMHPEKAL